MSRRIHRGDDDWNDDFPEEMMQPQNTEIEPSDDEAQSKPKKRMRVKKNVETQMPVDESNVSLESSSETESTQPSDLLTSLLRKIPRKSKVIEDLSQKSKEIEVAQQLSLKQHLCRPAVIYSILFIIVLLNALWVVHQTYYYRLDYLKLNNLKAQTQKLEMERGKMLIEKQTFGSSGQIATRATMQMGMFLPSNQQRIVIQVPQNVGKHDE